MKKLLIVFVALLVLTGCGNRKVLSFGNQQYNYLTCDESYINLKNEEIVTWKDYDGEQIEVTIENGNNLLVSSMSCFLSREKVN